MAELQARASRPGMTGRYEVAHYVFLVRTKYLLSRCQELFLREGAGCSRLGSQDFLKFSTRGSPRIRLSTSAIDSQSPPLASGWLRSTLCRAICGCDGGTGFPFVASLAGHSTFAGPVAFVFPFRAASRLDLSGLATARV